MDLNSKIRAEISQRANRPKGIKLSISAFRELESGGHITRAAGGPFGLVEWEMNMPWYDKDVYAWCDPSFEGTYQLPAT